MSAYSHQDYEAIEAALQESPHGRWFLDEFMRRNRTADTYKLLEAIRKLERGVVENSGLGNSPHHLGGDLAAGLQGLAEAIDMTLAGITPTGDDDGGATDEALAGQVRKTLEQLSAVRAQIRGLLAARSEGPDDGPLRSEEDLSYFEGDEDLFAPPQAAASPSLVLVREEKARQAADAPPQSPDAGPGPETDQRGDPRDRIVFIRRGSSKETSIPLADEAEDQPAGHSQQGS